MDTFDSWKYIDLYFKQFNSRCVIQHQINSYHYFIEEEIPNIIVQLDLYVLNQKKCMKNKRIRQMLGIIDVDVFMVGPGVEVGVVGSGVGEGVGIGVGSGVG